MCCLCDTHFVLQLCFHRLLTPPTRAHVKFIGGLMSESDFAVFRTHKVVRMVPSLGAPLALTFTHLQVFCQVHLFITGLGRSIWNVCMIAGNHTKSHLICIFIFFFAAIQYTVACDYPDPRVYLVFFRRFSFLLRGMFSCQIQYGNSDMLIAWWQSVHFSI